MNYVMRCILCYLVSFSLLGSNAGLVFAGPVTPERTSELTVRQESVSDQIAAQTVSMEQRKAWYGAVDKATKEEVATKKIITKYLEDMKVALSKKQTDQYKTLVDELNGLIISDLEREFSTLAKKVLAENNVYKLSVLQDNIAEGTISNADYVRAVNALYNNLYQPCKDKECEVRGAAMITLATAGKLSVAKKYGQNKELTNKIISRISGAAKQNYGGFEQDQIIGEHIIPALSILRSPTGQRTAVLNYVNKYGKKKRYQPTNEKDAFLIRLTEMAVEYPVLPTASQLKDPKAYFTPHLLAEWSNSDNFLLRIRGNVEIGRLPDRNKYFNAATLNNTRTYLKKIYCNVGNSYGTNVQGNDTDKALAKRDLALGYYGGRSMTDSLRATEDTRCVVVTPSSGDFEYAAQRDHARDLTKEIVLFTIPPGCALLAVGKVAKNIIRTVKLANKTGKPLRDVYRTAKSVKKGQKAYARAHATENLAKDIEKGNSALGKQGVQDVRAAATDRYTISIKGSGRTLEVSAAEGPAIQRIMDQAADNVATKQRAVSQARARMSVPPTSQQNELLAKAEQEYRVAVQEQNKVLEGIINNQSASEIESSLAKMRASNRVNVTNAVADAGSSTQQKIGYIMEGGFFSSVTVDDFIATLAKEGYHVKHTGEFVGGKIYTIFFFFFKEADIERVQQRLLANASAADKDARLAALGLYYDPRETEWYKTYKEMTTQFLLNDPDVLAAQRNWKKMSEWDRYKFIHRTNRKIRHLISEDPLPAGYTTMANETFGAAFYSPQRMGSEAARNLQKRIFIDYDVYGFNPDNKFTDVIEHLVHENYHYSQDIGKSATPKWLLDYNVGGNYTMRTGTGGLIGEYHAQPVERGVKQLGRDVAEVLGDRYFKEQITNIREFGVGLQKAEDASLKQLGKDMVDFVDTKTPQSYENFRNSVWRYGWRTPKEVEQYLKSFDDMEFWDRCEKLTRH